MMFIQFLFMVKVIGIKVAVGMKDEDIVETSTTHLFPLFESDEWYCDCPDTYDEVEYSTTQQPWSKHSRVTCASVPKLVTLVIDLIKAVKLCQYAVQNKFIPGFKNETLVHISIELSDWTEKLRLSVDTMVGRKLLLSDVLPVQFLNQLMPDLDTLHIYNHVVHSLNFLTDDSNLTSLSLINCDYNGTKSNVTSHLRHVSLKSLHLDYSPSIANIIAMSDVKFEKIKAISMKNTGIRYLKMFQNSNEQMEFQTLDLRGNPLDCRPLNWRWLTDHMNQTDFIVKGSCATPELVRGMELMKAIVIPELMGERVKLREDDTGPSTLTTICIITTCIIGAIIVVGAVIYLVLKYFNHRGSAVINDRQQEGQITVGSGNGNRFMDLKNLRI